MHALHATTVAHHRFHGPGVDYVGVALAAALSWLVVAGPGEAALIAAAIAAAHHRDDSTSVGAVAWLGALAGGSAGWLLGLRGGRALVTRPGPLLRVRQRMLRSGERIYERHGPLAVYFAPSWMAGIHWMRPARFLPANAVATLVWAVVVGLGAFLVGPSIADLASDVGLAVVGAAVVAAIALVVAGRLRRRHRAERP